MSKNTLVIFGASSGLAEGLVQALNKEDYQKVFLVYRSNIPTKNYDVGMTQVLESDFENQISENLSLYDSVDLIFFNGKVMFKKFESISKYDMDEMFEANIFSIIKNFQSVLKNNIQISKVITIGSNAGLYFSHHKYFSLYASAKTALLGLLRSLSAEFPNIQFIYYVCPSADTNIFQNGLVDKELMSAVKRNEIQNKRNKNDLGKELLQILKEKNFLDDVLYKSDL
jgi:short-subunit dehydrogenase